LATKTFLQHEGTHDFREDRTQKQLEMVRASLSKEEDTLISLG
jgi:hypothetical protein